MRVQHAARPSSGDGHPAQPQKHLLPRKGASLYRTNSLFIGATRTDERAFAILSLIATAKANGLFPRVQLSDVLGRLPTTHNRDIDLLLPLEGWTALND